jgi:hypothetical protein
LSYKELAWGLIDKMHTQPKTYTGGGRLNVGAYSAQGDLHELLKPMRWQSDNDVQGRWVAMFAGRSYIAAGASGRMSLQARPSSYRNMDHHLPLTWMVDMIQAKQGWIFLNGATDGNMGLQNDGNGFTGMDMLQVDPVQSYVRVGVGAAPNGGDKKVFADEFEDLGGYYWDLPSAGTYTLVTTLNAFSTAAGWAKVKLSVGTMLGVASVATAKLLVDDVDDVEYGTSTRLLMAWEKKEFTLVEHAVSFTWSTIEVTGGMRVMLQGMKKADGEMGTTSIVADGSCTFLWYKTDEVVAPALV